MVRGRGAGASRNRSTRRGRSDSLTDTRTQRGEECICGTCGDDVGPNPVGCDKCEQWVHGTQMCSGLPQDLLDAILKYQGDGIQFVCMRCRVDQVTARGNSPSGHTDPQLAETVKQLHTQVRGMCSAIRELVSQVKALSSRPTEIPNHDAAVIPTATPAVPQPQALAPSQQDYRSLVREELKEQKEREKRRSFLVVKGLSASSPSDFGAKFAQLTSEVMGTRVNVSEVMPILGQNSYFRVKIPDDSSRKLLLDRAKQLKGTVHDHVYIARDLTYAQRTELYRRRHQTRLSQAKNAGVGGAEETVQGSPVLGTAAMQVDHTLQPLAAPNPATTAAASLGN